MFIGRYYRLNAKCVSHQHPVQHPGYFSPTLTPQFPLTPYGDGNMKRPNPPECGMGSFCLPVVVFVAVLDVSIQTGSRTVNDTVCAFRTFAESSIRVNLLVSFVGPDVTCTMTTATWGEGIVGPALHPPQGSEHEHRHQHCHTPVVTRPSPRGRKASAPVGWWRPGYVTWLCQVTPCKLTACSPPTGSPTDQGGIFGDTVLYVRRLSRHRLKLLERILGRPVIHPCLRPRREVRQDLGAQCAGLGPSKLLYIPDLPRIQVPRVATTLHEIDIGSAGGRPYRSTQLVV